VTGALSEVMTREVEPKATVAVAMKACLRHGVEGSFKGAVEEAEAEVEGAEAEDDLPECYLLERKVLYWRKN
jgi:hypothetical protein